MGEIVPLFDDGKEVEVAKGRTEGQALYAAIVDAQNATGAKSPPALIARAVKAGKDALAGGVPAEAVLVGCLASLRRGRPDLAPQMINDIAHAMVGEHLTDREWQQHLMALNRDNNRESTELRDAYEKALAKMGRRTR